MNRRNFVKCTTELAALAFVGTRSVAAAAKPLEKILATTDAGLLSSESYDALVPDTLDLAERARLSVNALTGAVMPEFGYETPHNAHLDHRPPYMEMWTAGPCHPKVLHVLPLMRVASGSKQHEDYDPKIFDFCVRNIGADGLWWLKREGRPWHAAYKADAVWVGTTPRIIMAFIDQYKLTGNTHLLGLAGKLIGGLSKIAASEGDKAWLPPIYWRTTGWDVAKDWWGSEAIWTNGQAAHAYYMWYTVSGDKAALKMAGKFVNKVLDPTHWKSGNEPEMIAPMEQGMWVGHFHLRTMGLMYTIPYAAHVHDTRSLEYAAKLYEYALKFGIPRIGYFPGVIHKKYTREVPQNDEACGIGNMVGIGIWLSDAGVGDYWDDVDCIVRNNLVEHQMTDLELMKQVVAGSPVEPNFHNDMHVYKDVLERNVGCFGSVADPTWMYAWWTMCCNTNAAQGLYRAWESIVRSDRGVGTVNLLLNRASAWLDVDSYLPYEGRVVLKNKTCRKVNVRMSKWVDKRAVRCRVNGKELGSLDWAGNYLSVDELRPGDEVSIVFPMVETTERWTEMTYKVTYTCQFKGNTLVDISPRFDKPMQSIIASDDGLHATVQTGYPMYRRDHYKGNQAPLIKRQRHIPTTII